ncbi:Retrovirus-related Pol polyprotein from transposon [Zancudomyces culisetae]|uniref:RNA-directed DNA polymerase n=1 Tax=Zancudomyces culisetae TaxID=1213189 RepID=A0A1R1PPQ9_ZANCU|nr:Retrovirus-related Pol polyprotein from transposon [Zancudomyces culisetae]|eukprot:OMH82939.1 Retrovirus-related Pol polyprotein from transposon [Zancudomyces culisetae]
MNTIHLFESASGEDPEEWIADFCLVDKLNKWDKDDWIDFIQLYLGKIEKLWYKKHKMAFKDWADFKTQFTTQYQVKEQRFQYYEKLKNIDQNSFETVEEFEYNLENILDKAGINEDVAKIDWLLSALNTDSRSIVKEFRLKTWKSIIEKLKKVQEEAVHKQVQVDNTRYEQMVKKMDEWSLNIISKVDETIEKRLKNTNVFPYKRENPRVVKCYYCHQLGHRKYECNKLKEQQAQEQSKINKDVSFLEVCSSQQNDNEVLAVQRTPRTQDTKKPYNKTKPLQLRQKGYTPITEYDRAIERQDIVMETGEPEVVSRIGNTTAGLDSRRRETSKTGEKLEDSVKQVEKPRAKGVLGMAEGIPPFSLKEQLSSWCPNISFPQLMDVSPSLNNEMISLCRRSKKAELNEIRFDIPRFTNCKIRISIFESNFWAVVDTGAACSVAAPGLLEQWGLIAEDEGDQIIITADGNKHYSLGRIMDVPLMIGRYKFTVNLTVMDRNDNTLILGTDWLLEHKAQLNLKTSEMKLPVEQFELIVPLHTSAPSLPSSKNTSELYYVLKEEVAEINGLQRYNDMRFDKIKQDNSDIFADDIEQLTQTEEAEHRILLNDETPVKLKPYRIPHHLYSKVRDELKKMEEKGIISQCVSECKVQLHTDKCFIGMKELEYLGHVVSPQGLRTSKAKVESIEKAKLPTTVKELQSFLGLIGFYRKYVNGFSIIVAPLLKLLKKGTEWKWTPECGQAVTKIKHELTNAPTLAHPDWSREFIVTTDASVTGIGGILSQSYDEEERPICYVSRITNQHERNYSISHFEGLAVVWSIKKLKYYLWGKHFTVRTDHKSLIQLFNSTEITGRVARWAMILRNYDYTIVHCEGKSNPADALSRL